MAAKAWKWSPADSTAESVSYTDTALEFGLAASRGSDFHSPEESRTELGALPDLPGQLTPVWTLLADRILRAPQAHAVVA
jgi:hypothetical protein